MCVRARGMLTTHDEIGAHTQTRFWPLCTRPSTTCKKFYPCVCKHFLFGTWFFNTWQIFGIFDMDNLRNDEIICYKVLFFLLCPTGSNQWLCLLPCQTSMSLTSFFVPCGFPCSLNKSSIFLFINFKRFVVTSGAIHHRNTFFLQ